MSENNMLCMGCMQPLETQGYCPLCGYNNNSANPDSYLQPKTVLDSRYIVGRLLSSNGESGLYIGFDNVTGNRVFIKEYMPVSICSRSENGGEIIVNQGSIVQYKNYMSEFVELNKGLSRLRTMPHIITPIDMFTANNTAYVIAPYCEGITLNQHLHNNAGELSWDQVKRLFPPLLTTLSCVHNAGILHRGISLENILVTDRGELKLTGFAIAEIRSADTDLPSELSVGFSAPEQYSVTEWEGTWTDVYAVAAVIYRLLTGCMPLDAVSRLANDTILEPSKINDHIPANVSKVIMKAMRLSCEQRIKTVTEFVTKLFEEPDSASRTATQTMPFQVQRRAEEVKKEKPKKVYNKRSASNAGTVIASVLLMLVVVATVVGLVTMFTPNDTTQPPDNPVTDTPTYVTTTNTDTTEITTEQTTAQPVTTQPSGSMFVMPNFVGKLYSNVSTSETWKNRIEFEIEYGYSEIYGVGYIYDQDIPSGTALYPVAKVKVYVSQGISTVEIPSFMNYFGFRLSKEEYAEILDSLGITYEFRELSTPYEETGYVMGVICAETGATVGESINIIEGHTLYVDISVYNPDESAAG